MNFDNKEYYINRELSFLAFNERVLQEAMDNKNPILERFKFLAITASNLDEFFMVRVSILWQQEDRGIVNKDVSGLSPREALIKISEQAHEFVKKQYNCLTRSLIPKIEKENIFFRLDKNVNKEQKKFVKDYFENILFPILTPMAIDQSRPFPHLANKSLNFIVELAGSKEGFYAVVQVPTVVSRLLELPSNGHKKEFIMLEEIIRANIHRLFEGYNVKEAYLFRLTRNSDLDFDEEGIEDLLVEIEESIKKRKWGAPVRLEIQKNMTQQLRSFLIEAFELYEEEVYEIASYFDLSIWMKLAGLSGYNHLKNKPLPPQPVKDFTDERTVFDVIKEKDVMVYHPYESFHCVVNFVETAAVDAGVLAIKQTLYRVGGDSPIVAALIKAAENGKQVTVLVEVKARFDEENNILWARKLEKAGCHVTYGLVGLKTHCKICLVVRKEEDGIKRYVHLGTGNYNDSTAKLYTDIGFFTCKETFGVDCSALFNVLTGYSVSPKWKKLAVAPHSLRETFEGWINNEIKYAKEGREAKIVAKMNSLADELIIQKLYEASCAGVKIDLIIRGICCLRPGIKNVSENIRVISIVDRFLEHTRIFCFHNDANPKVFLSSADWMQRNLNRRVEILFPVEQEDLKARVIEILAITLKDTEKARILDEKGHYQRVDKRGKEPVHSQLLFHQMASENARVTIRTDELLKPIYNPNLPKR